jgi:hypothetical protein
MKGWADEYIDSCTMNAMKYKTVMTLVFSSSCNTNQLNNGIEHFTAVTGNAKEVSVLSNSTKQTICVQRDAQNKHF